MTLRGPGVGTWEVWVYITWRSAKPGAAVRHVRKRDRGKAKQQRSGMRHRRAEQMSFNHHYGPLVWGRIPFIVSTSGRYFLRWPQHSKRPSFSVVVVVVVPKTYTENRWGHSSY